MPRPSDFMLAPTDWRKDKAIGGGGKWRSTAPRFPETKQRFQDFTTSGTAGSIAQTVKKLPNPTGASFKSASDRFPVRKPTTDFAIKPESSFGKGRSTATSAFKATTPQRPEPKKALTEFTAAVPKLDTRGNPLSGVKPGKSTSAWTKGGSHADFLPG